MMWRRWRYLLGRRALQRQARRQVKAGSACLVAVLVARGEWAAMDRLLAELEGGA